MKIDGLPEGWELVRIGKPKKGDWYLSTFGNGPSEAQFDFARELHPILRKLPEPLQLREGAWYMRRDGKVVGPCKKSVSKYYDMECGDYSYYADGTISKNVFTFGCDLIREVPAPKQAVDPGEGWRLLGVGELIEKGDERWNGFVWTTEGWVGIKQGRGLPVRRRIAPAYRPFKSAAEYRPNMQRQIRTIGNDGEIFHLACHVSNTQMNLIDWQWWLDNGTFYDDGTPCGVKL